MIFSISCVFIKFEAPFIHDHFQLGVGLKRIVLRGSFFLPYLFVIFNLTLNLTLRSGGDL